CDSTGNNCTSISGAEAQSYTLAAGNVGDTIRVTESANNASGGGGPVASAATSVVQAPALIPSRPVSTTPPTAPGSGTQTGTWTGTGVPARTGSPIVSDAALSGIVKKRPSLTFTVAAGKGA